jgi:hypothetical protein
VLKTKTNAKGAKGLRRGRRVGCVELGAGAGEKQVLRSAQDDKVVFDPGKGSLQPTLGAKCAPKMGHPGYS